MENYTVLVIEDDEAARKMLAKAVKKEGFEVLTAENGRVGLETFEKEAPQIIITDLKMPEVSGMEVLQKVKKISPHVEVVLITGFGETDTAIQALREGALDYIKKPIDLDQLSLALGRAKEKVVKYKKAEPFPALLLAEDEESARASLSGFLKKDGWKVYEAADGEEAVKVFQQEKIDIVLLDIKMPKLSGLDSLIEMRRVSDDFEAIILTGYGDETSAIKAMQGGAMNFLKKPIDLEQLLVTLEKAVEKLHLHRSLKFRTRELELAEEIIAKITTEKELVVDVRDQTETESKNFAQNLIEALPLGLVVLNEDMGVCYVNRHLADALEYYPKKFDEKLVDDLQKTGIEKLSYSAMISTINKILESPMGTIEVVPTSKYGFLTLTTIIFLREEGKEKHVLMALRGERK